MSKCSAMHYAATPCLFFCVTNIISMSFRHCSLMRVAPLARIQGSTRRRIFLFILVLSLITLSFFMRKTKLCLVLYLQPCVMVSCLFGAESPLRLLACRGRTASLLRQARNLRGLAGTHQLSAIPPAPEPLRFDSWPRHWGIGLKTGQNLILSFPAKKDALGSSPTPERVSSLVLSVCLFFDQAFAICYTSRLRIDPEIKSMIETMTMMPSRMIPTRSHLCAFKAKINGAPIPPAPTIPSIEAERTLISNR